MDTRRLNRNNFELRPRVKHRLEEARQALDTLHAEQEAYLNPPDEAQDPLFFGSPKKAVEDRTIYDLTGIREAFDALEQNLQRHLEAEEVTVYPALRTFMKVGGSVTPLLEAQRSEHVDLLHDASAVRREVQFVAPLRQPMNALFQHLDKQIQYEETRIFPELMGEDVADETPIPNRYRTSTDVAKTLRRARPKPSAEPEPKGLFGGLFKRWLGGDR
jgi:hypothetical protein